MATNKYGVVQKNWLTAFILSLFFGVVGADRFYLGKAGTAVLKLVTLGGLGIWALVDFIMIASKSMPGVEWVGGDSKKDKKTAWTIFGVALLLGLIINVTASDNSTPYSSSTTSTSSESEPTVANEIKQPDVPAEYKSALASATDYANTMNMSKQGVYDQLVSEYGDKFTAKAAKYAIANVSANWKANALASAKSYQENMNMSPAAIHDQLTSEYGDKFTKAQADYAIKHLND